MKVKKLFWAALTVMCAMTMTMTFTACGGDDDNSDTPSKSEIKGISGRYLISVNEKMAELCDGQRRHRHLDEGREQYPVTSHLWRKD